jgi:copper resistance protein D
MNHSPVLGVVIGFPMLVCEVLSFGLAGFAVIVARGEGHRDARASALTIIRFLAIAALIIAPIVLAHQTAEMADVSMRDAIAIIPMVLRQTHEGRVWVWRIAILIALAIASWVAPIQARAPILLPIGAALLLMRALASHAIDHGPIAIAIYAAHEIGAGLWIGCLLGLFAGYRIGASAEFIQAARRVSSTAAWCLVVIALSGAFTAWQGLEPRFDNLIYSAYGRVLIVKLAIASIAVGAGAVNRFRVMPNLDRDSSRVALRTNVGFEIAVLAVVLVCTVVLASTPPAH